MSNNQKIKKQHFVFHVLLGWLCLFTPIPFIIWFYIVLITFIQKINKATNEKALTLILVFLMYTGSFELLGRMSYSSPWVPYELGKYLTFSLSIWGLFKARKFKYTGLLIVLLLIPGIIIGLPYCESYKDVVFNVLGTINIGLGISIFGYLRLDISKVLNFLRLLLLPIVSVAAYSVIRMPNLEETEFELGANTVVGGFGSNQVATVFGLGLFIGFVLWNNRISILGLNRVYDLVLIGAFLILGLLTFSRGGMIGGGLGILIWLFYQSVTKRKSKGISFVTIVFIVLPIISIGIIYANNLTNGNLFLRYSGETEGTLIGRKEKDLNQLTTGRLELFLEDVDIFLENSLLGVGIKQSVYKRELTNGTITHVEVSRLLSEHGFFGMTITLIFLFLMLHGFKMGFKGELHSLTFILFVIGFYTTFHAATRTFVSPLFMSLIFVRKEKSASNLVVFK